MLLWRSFESFWAFAPIQVVIELVDMKILPDCFDRQVRLTDERLAHILEHPEMREMGRPSSPPCGSRKLSAVRDRTCPSAFFMSFMHKLWLVASGSVLWLNIATAMLFIVTAYLTGQPKAGENLWPTK